MATIKRWLQRISLVFAFSAITLTFAAVSYKLYKAQDPYYNLEKELVSSDNTICKVLFSPDDKVKDMLIGLINNEKKSIMCAIYTMTERDITKAFINAKKRGVSLEFVVDRSYASDRYSRVAEIANHHIPVWVFQAGTDERITGLMHNKFCVFKENVQGKSLVWTGSYNFTKRASTANQENALVLDAPTIVQCFTEQFAVLKNRSLLISGITGTNYTRGGCGTESSWLDLVWKLLNEKK